MSDSTAYDLAADLTDFLSAAIPGITLPEGCPDPIDRVYTAAGEPDAWVCGEVAVWVSGWGPTNIPNQELAVDQSTCAAGTYVEINWRVVTCISKSADGKTPISVEAHEADAECFYTLAYGLYRRIQTSITEIWPVDCKRITGGSLTLGRRAGGMLSAGQTFRVGVDLTDPDSDSS